VALDASHLHAVEVRVEVTLEIRGVLVLRGALEACRDVVAPPDLDELLEGCLFEFLVLTAAYVGG